MKQEFFIDQINRLKTRFGAKSFDIELVKLIGREVASLPEDFFRKRIDTWIGERKTGNPPLLVDFRESRLSFERENLNRETKAATRSFGTSLKDVLREHYKVDTVKEAFELEQMKLRLKK